MTEPTQPPEILAALIDVGMPNEKIAEFLCVETEKVRALRSLYEL